MQHQVAVVTERVETVVHVDGRRVHRFQVVRERRPDGRVEDWVVVGFADGTVDLADLDFEWTRTAPYEAFLAGDFEPLSAGGVPVWGY